MFNSHALFYTTCLPTSRARLAVMGRVMRLPRGTGTASGSEVPSQADHAASPADAYAGMTHCPAIAASIATQPVMASRIRRSSDDCSVAWVIGQAESQLGLALGLSVTPGEVIPRVPAELGLGLNAAKSLPLSGCRSPSDARAPSRRGSAVASLDDELARACA
jgi:hypothetical protein